MNYVILGAGPAGVTAAESIRRHDAKGKITLVGGEDSEPYSRMAIPYLLTGRIAEKGTHLRQTAGHYDQLGIVCMQGRAGGLDTKGRQLFLSGGEALAYDKLLIATGASPIRPRIEGLNLEGVHTCWTLQDAAAIIKLCDQGAKVVLIGAGFIGSIILEALVARGADLTVVEMGDRMVPRMMDETAGNMMKRWCEGKGVRVVTSRTVTKVERDSAGLKVTLSDASTLPARLVVLAAGVRSNTGFLVGTGIDVGQGVKVDRYLESTVQHVFAAGDVAEATDLSTGKNDVLAIQPIAVEHGRIAGQNMAGVRTAFEGGLNMNVLDTLGLVSSSFGLWQGAKLGTSGRATDEAKFRYLRLEFEGERLVGGQAVGRTDHIGILRGLIQTRLKLGAWRQRLIAAPERLTEAYVAVAHGHPSAGWTKPHVNVPA